MLLAASAHGADGLGQSFAKQIQPLLEKACGNCHGTVPMDNELDLTSFGSAEVILAKPKLLGDVAERLRLGDMPPKDAPQPSEAARDNCWVGSLRRSMPRRRRGPVIPGRSRFVG